MARMTQQRLDQLAGDRSISQAERTELVNEIRAAWADVAVLRTINVDSSLLQQKLDIITVLTARLEALPVLKACVPVSPGSGGSPGGGFEEPPVPSGPPLGGTTFRVNEPGGHSTFLDWDATSEIPISHEHLGLTEEVDAEAPVSPTGVRRSTIDPTGLPANTQIGSGFTAIHSADATSVYIARAMKWHTPFQVDGSGCKSMFVQFSSGGSIYFNYTDELDGIKIQPLVSLPQNPEHDMRNDTWLPCNIETVLIPKGDWGQLEFQVVMNTPGDANGILRVWINGTLVIELTDYRWLSASESGIITHIIHNMYHNNGQTPTMAQIQYVDLDHFYISRVAA